jgi:hypothetical protein
LVPANAIQSPDQENADVEEDAAVEEEASSSQEIGTVRSYVRAVESTSDQSVWEVRSRDVVQVVVRRVGDTVQNANRPLRIVHT